MRRFLTTIIITSITVLVAYAQGYIIQCEDTCTHIHGLDMSHYQGDIFWETVGNNSRQYFVYLKASEGGDRIDEKYVHNIEMARRHNMKVGSYHFFRARIPVEEQLRNFRMQCLPQLQDLVPMIDIESVPSGMGSMEFCDSLKKFLRLVEREYRQKPIVYTYTNFYNKHLVGQVDDYLLWIAQYSESEPRLRDERDYILWQYTGKGRINGVNTFVDKNRLMGSHSMRELRFRRY